MTRYVDDTDKQLVTKIESKVQDTYDTLFKLYSSPYHAQMPTLTSTQIPCIKFMTPYLWVADSTHMEIETIIPLKLQWTRSELRGTIDKILFYAMSDGEIDFMRFDQIENNLYLYDEFKELLYTSNSSIKYYHTDLKSEYNKLVRTIWDDHRPYYFRVPANCKPIQVRLSFIEIYMDEDGLHFTPDLGDPSIEFLDQNKAEEAAWNKRVENKLTDEECRDLIEKLKSKKPSKGLVEVKDFIEEVMEDQAIPDVYRNFEFTYNLTYTGDDHWLITINLNPEPEFKVTDEVCKLVKSETSRMMESFRKSISEMMDSFKESINKKSITIIIDYELIQLGKD